MTERPRQHVGSTAPRTTPGLLGVAQSVFRKLVVVMGVMAVSLLALVGGFFWFVGGPARDGTIRRMLEGQSRTVAASSPDLATAIQLRNRLGVQTRYEGPAGSWSTSSDLPPISDVRRGPLQQHLRLVHGDDYYVVAAPDGGSYLFSWDVSQTMQGAHLRLVILLLLVISGIVLTAHTILRRHLRPLRELSAGVARLRDGELDVVLPARSRDEFGRLTLAFNEMVARVRQMVAARDQLLLDVSHELRSPVTRLKVALELLPASEQRTRMAADLSEMETMIAELLELERLRSGGLSKVRQNVIPLLRDVADRFQGRPPGIRVIEPGEPIALDLDGERMRMALRNIVENALKYSLPDSRAVELSASGENGHLVIRVTDDGPGIPEHDTASVFEPFFRVDRSRSKKTGGYGLGLSIAKRIVESHGGTIAAENNPDRGASFIVTLPALPGLCETAPDLAGSDANRTAATQ